MAKRAKMKQKSNQCEQDNNLIDLNTYRKQRKRKVELIPRNLKQEKFQELLEDQAKKIIFATGPAGSGKTWIATLWGIQQLREKNIEKLVITRPNVAVDDKDIGYLPGDVMAKMTPWMMPILDILEEYYTPKEISQLVDEKIIEICPIAYIRGRTFKNSFVLVDEAQGTTPNSMKSILTRIGENSRMVVTGDTKQSDHGQENGLTDFINRFEECENIGLVQFDPKDVERSEVVKNILHMYGEQS